MVDYNAPYKESRLSKFIADKIDALSSIKNQRAIAMEIGYQKSPNMLSMIRSGTARLPLDKVPALAKALFADPVDVFKMALEQNWPEGGPSLEEVIGPEITANEREILAFIREVSGHSDPELTTKAKTALTNAFRPKTRAERIEAIAAAKKAEEDHTEIDADE